MKEIDSYFLQKEEPVKSCLLALRRIILQLQPGVVEMWRYSMPFYCIKLADGIERRFCYLWIHKSLEQPYIGIVDGKYFDQPELISEKRSKMKIMLIDPEQDIPVDKIQEILNKAIQFTS